MRSRWVTGVVLVALLAAACGSRTEGGDAEAPDGTDDGEATAAQVDNGGATDVGVTGDELRIAVVADLTGVVPGLFKSAVDAVKAYAAKVNEEEGGIHGRELVVEEFDTGTNDNGNRLAYEKACDEAFASVGSESAFDTGGFEAVRDCGFPHLPGFTTDPQLADLPFVYPRDSEAYTGVGAARWFAEEFPQAVEKASLFFVSAPVTERSADRLIEARGSVGWEYVYEQPISPLESNYTPHALEMKRRDVQAFSVIADFNNTVRLQKALREQDHEVTIAEVGTQGYSQDYLEAAGPTAEGSFAALTHAMFEEADEVPAMDEYLTWLERTAPGEEPSSNGLLAWTRAMLFAEAAEAAGPEITRDSFMEALEGLGTWDADGLLPPSDVSEPIPEETCFLIARVDDGEYTRVFPDEGFHCSPDDVYLYEEAD